MRLEDIQFICILCIACSTLFMGRRCVDRKDLRLLQSGMLLTACADFCMLIAGKALEGLIFFMLVQTIYSFRYDPDNKGKTAFFIIICVSVIGVFADFVGIERIYTFGAMYALCLCVSFLKAIGQYRKEIFPKENRIMILLGMVFFLLCDINVALYNIIAGANPIIHTLIWVFYLPSQVFLAASGISYKFKLTKH